MVAWWNLGLPRLVFSPEPTPIHARIEARQSARHALAGDGCDNCNLGRRKRRPAGGDPAADRHHHCRVAFAQLPTGRKARTSVSQLSAMISFIGSKPAIG
jgi:hypothetical protein